MFRTLVFIFFTISYFVNASPTNENTLDSGKVLAQGKPITLLGNGVSIGDKAPDFKVVDSQFSPHKLSDYRNQIILIAATPSLDTGVCSLQAKYFNEKIAKQFPQVKMVVISTDLPFAQKRFCNNENIDNLALLSDAVWRSFGMNYGLLIQGMGLLTRAVIILDREHNIIYKQLVSNLASEVNYTSIINKLNSL